MKRKIFRGVGALVAKVITHRRFQIATKIAGNQRFAFDEERYIEIDLDQTPNHAASWDEVRVDDRGIDVERRPLAGATTASLLTGFHVTSIGGYVGPDRPDDLSQGTFVGAVYLEDNYFESVRARVDLADNRWPCDGRRTYQLTTIAYARSPENGSRRGLRYAGWEARIVRRLDETRREIELIDIYDRVAATIELDLRLPHHCDDAPPVAPNERALSAASGPGERGALFVELGQLAAHALENPKLPIGLGG